MIIRSETMEDIQGIFEINQMAFGQKDEADLVNRIRGSSQYVDGLSLVAEMDDRIVGHILFSKISIDTHSGVFECLGLAPLAVLPEYQTKGIGSELVQAGLTKCVEMGYGLLIVLGHPKFYPKFGFFPASQLGICADFGVPIPDEAFMACECIQGTWKFKSGVVRYPSTFDGLE